MSDNMELTALDNFSGDKVRHYLERGKESEKRGNSSSAIENYLNAMDCIDETTEDYAKYDLYIRLGDIYQLIGKLDDGLIQFQNAYKMSIEIGNNILQVDSSLRIANSYLYKNEVKNGVKYADEADSVLARTDYKRGKLESSIFWSRYYYLNHDNFKAREICIESLKAGEEDCFIERGKLLNIFAELSSSLISDEEYLTLLNQAFECFEKAKYERGMLGVLNNIGHVYDINMQNYQKSLEYFLLLKEKCEKSIFVEFSLLACVNIGEINLKLFKYEEALRWFKEAEGKPIGSYTDNAELYIFIFISQAYIKLYNYKEAYKYFTLASSEISTKNVRGTTLICYYNLAAVLFDEFGKREKSAAYSKKAMEAAASEQSLLKWETGTVYELIKLKHARNRTDILGVLEGIRHLITKYKDPSTILDIIYSFSLHLMDGDYEDLAFKLLEEFKHVDSDLEIIKLKKSYFDAVKESNYPNKILILENLMKLSIKLKDNNMIIRINSSLGDYYFRDRKFEVAAARYQNACEYANRIMSDVPEEFKIGLINTHSFNKIFNKLDEAKKMISI